MRQWSLYLTIRVCFISTTWKTASTDGPYYSSHHLAIILGCALSLSLKSLMVVVRTVNEDAEAAPKDRLVGVVCVCEFHMIII